MDGLLGVIIRGRVVGLVAKNLSKFSLSLSKRRAWYRIRQALDIHRLVVFLSEASTVCAAVTVESVPT